MQKVYSLIMGQFRKGFQSKVEGIPDQPTIANNGEPILLLGKIKTLMFNFQSTKYPPCATQNYKMFLYTYRQDRYTSVHDYNKSFKNNIDVIKHNRGTLGINRGVVALELTRQYPHI